jgi:hypothetical protein
MAAKIGGSVLHEALYQCLTDLVGRILLSTQNICRHSGGTRPIGRGSEGSGGLAGRSRLAELSERNEGILSQRRKDAKKFNNSIKLCTRIREVGGERL